MVSSIVNHLHEVDLLPCICFSFSRKQCDILAAKTSGIPRSDSEQRYDVRQKARSILSSKVPNFQAIIDSPDYERLMQAFEKGTAPHHAGMLPSLRELVEVFFEEGIVKVLFATETFAIGINMPTRSVVFTSTRKYDGFGRRLLRPYEYTQMAGRAGRRGLDDKGVVVHCMNMIDVDDVDEYKRMMNGGSRRLESKLRVDANLILDILSNNDGKVQAITNFIADTMAGLEAKENATQTINKVKTLEESLAYAKEAAELCRCPETVYTRYRELLLSKTAPKQEKKQIEEISRCLEDNPLEKDCAVYDRVHQLAVELDAVALEADQSCL